MFSKSYFSTPEILYNRNQKKRKSASTDTAVSRSGIVLSAFHIPLIEYLQHTYDVKALTGPFTYRNSGVEGIVAQRVSGRASIAPRCPVAGMTLLRVGALPVSATLGFSCLHIDLSVHPRPSSKE